MSRLALSGLAAAVLLAAGVRAQPAAPAYEVYAVRFADVSYSVANLVAGAERGRSIDITFTIWVARDPASSRIVLVDAGFYRDTFLQQWHPNHFVKPSDALTQGLGIAPDAVTDIIVSHMHYDHAGNRDLFPNATYHVQDSEINFCTGRCMCNSYLNHAFDVTDVQSMVGKIFAGRVHFHDGVVDSHGGESREHVLDRVHAN